MNELSNCCEGERWLPVPGYEGRYVISTCGRILSLSRPVRSKHGTTYLIPTRLMHGTIFTNKYRMVHLSDGHRKRCLAVHRLVLVTFLGPCSEGMESCHNDGNRVDNHLVNLRWDTPAANRKDQSKHGTAQRGESHGRSPLMNADIHRIRELGSQGIPQRTIAKQYGISQAAISKIVRCESWSHI